MATVGVVVAGLAPCSCISSSPAALACALPCVLRKHQRHVVPCPPCDSSLVSSFQVKFFYLCQLAYWLHALPELYFQKVRKVSMCFSCCPREVPRASPPPRVPFVYRPSLPLEHRVWAVLEVDADSASVAVPCGTP